MGRSAVAPEETAANRPKRPGLGRRNLVLLVIGVLVVVAIALLNVIHLPVAILRPGPVQNIFGSIGSKPVLEVHGVPTYPTSGTLDFTTVSMAGGPQYPVSVMEWIGAHFDSNAEIDPASEWFVQGVSGKQVQQQNTAEMTNAQTTARAVALRAAGITVPETISIAYIAPKSPAGGVLRTGDLIDSINGTPTHRLDTIHQVMAKVAPGSSVTMQVTRHGAKRTLRVPTTDNNGQAVFGIGIEPKYDFRARIKINVGQVGGPSAGTMLALAIYDKITPGKLTGGKRFAGTGTISEDGTVGPIGGIRQKMAGAKNAGAKYFLAPGSDCDQARGHVPDGLTVIRIDTFQQAISVIEKVAAGHAAGLPSCR